MRNQVMLMLALMCAVMSAQAKPRTMEQMRQAAAEVLADSESDLNMRKAPRKVMMLQQMGGVAGPGMTAGAFPEGDSGGWIRKTIPTVSFGLM